MTGTLAERIGPLSLCDLSSQHGGLRVPQEQEWRLSSKVTSTTFGDQDTGPSQFKSQERRLHLLMRGAAENVTIFNPPRFLIYIS